MLETLATDYKYMSFVYFPIHKISQQFLETFFYELGLDKGKKRALSEKYIKNRKAAFNRILSSLIIETQLDDKNACYHSLATSSFTDELVSHRSFKTITQELIKENYLFQIKGHVFHRSVPETGEIEQPKACHFYPTEKLIRKCLAHQITPKQFERLFAKEKPTHFVKVKFPSTRKGKHRHTGKTVPYSKIKKIKGYQAQQNMIEKINNNLWSQHITNASFNGLHRSFNNYIDQKEYQLNQGGRLYSYGNESFQSLPKEKRRKIKINDQTTVEIDIKSSHLSILHGLMDISLKKEDPYKIGDIPRDVVKAWMTITLSQASPLRRWPNKERHNLVMKGYDMDHWSAPKVSNLALEKYPFLSDMNTQHHGWANLQFIESELIIKTMLELIDEHNIPSLPVHDSLIVPEAACELTMDILRKHFSNELGIDVQLKVSREKNEIKPHKDFNDYCPHSKDLQDDKSLDDYWISSCSNPYDHNVDCNLFIAEDLR